MTHKHTKSAIILGASGLTGSHLLELLLDHPGYHKVICILRRPLDREHPKLEQHTGDLFEMNQFAPVFRADEVYCCIGTTQAKTPDKETYEKIDKGIPVAAAALCVENSIPVYCVISAMGANAKSGIFYNRLKGQMEEEVLQAGVPSTYIVQPGLISGDRKEKRAFESTAKFIFRSLEFLLQGPLKKYRAISPEAIAKAMIKLAGSGKPSGRSSNEELLNLSSVK